ncbi:response regulator [Roseospira marina]|uniref:Response regulator n=1 Tax=Roseospira marina TaxID=140057 RepID=A0A5M6I6D7_9PROT|nr:response regulator [Roseospira marina]KAA5603810.1 response regulator [Roseospira marina]MBB4316021.1 two-component system chemotaxis response regulator CheY [Roseospira marina]MBB5089187.1 two-component system chemotaxis response regulator CheY [Roseospira marina]
MKSILLVDDSPTILASVGQLLERTGYKVTTAKHGEEACALVDGGLTANIVITDQNMPGMSGIDLIRTLRKKAGYRFTPMLVLTTETQQVKREEAKAAGATGWLVKPVAPDQLAAVLKKVSG